MRFLLELDAPDPRAIEVAAAACQKAGIDGVFLTSADTLPAPLVVASAVAGAVDDILIAAEVTLGNRHPLEVAEEAAVVDLVSRGRLVLVAIPAIGFEDGFREAVDLLRAAWAARPFASPGPRWPTPSRLPEHVNDAPDRVRVTPAPFGPTLELWLGGSDAEGAVARGLGHLAARGVQDAQLAKLWAAPGLHAMHAPRARREAWSTAETLVARLRRGRAAFGQDWAVINAELAAVAEIGAYVRPRLQLETLPDGLEPFWDSHVT